MYLNFLGELASPKVPQVEGSATVTAADRGRAGCSDWSDELASSDAPQVEGSVTGTVTDRGRAGGLPDDGVDAYKLAAGVKFNNGVKLNNREYLLYDTDCDF